MKRLPYLLFLALLVVAPNLPAQSVKTTWQNNAPFSSYKTFAWKDPKTPGLPFYGQWVKPDVIKALSSKGLTQAASGQTPDVIATFHIQGQELVDAETTSDGFDYGAGPWGGGWGYWGGWGGWEAGPIDTTSFTSESPRQIVILTVDLFDAKAKKLIWRGQATVENVSTSEKGDMNQTAKCVEKMFKSYPPKKK
jgi:hypothetical protein